MEQNNLSSQSFEQIERYLLDEMNEQEKRAFESRLETEQSLRNEVELHRNLIAAIQVQTFSQELLKAEAKSITKPPVRIGRRWLVAASIIVLLAAGAIWWMKRSSFEENLYAKYYSPDPGLPTTMAISDNYEFERGMVDYKQGKFEAALLRWESLQSNTANDTLSYFISMASLNSGNAVKAIPYLQKLSANNSSAWHDAATWYLALENLKAGRMQAAIELLKQIPSYANASALLNELQKR